MSTIAAPESETTERPEAPPPAASAPSAPRSRRPIVLGVLAIALVAVTYFGVPKWTYSRAHESTDNAQVDGDIVPLVARVGGFVSRILVGENQRVKTGDTLVVLDVGEYRVRLAQADAELEAARFVAGGRAGVGGQSQAIVRGATSQRASLDAQVSAARASLQKAQADLGRMKELADKQIISRQQLDASQLAVESATANLESSERQLSGATAGVDNAEAGTRLAHARLASAQAARDNAALLLGYTVMTAPQAGVVSRKQIEPGQLVQAGQPVLTIVGDKDIWVSANFKETQLAKIRVGEPVEIDVDAYDGCRASGTVESLGAATGAKFALIPPDNATGNFTKVVQRVPVRIRITSGCGPDRPLRPGMSVMAHVETR